MLTSRYKKPLILRNLLSGGFLCVSVICCCIIRLSGHILSKSIYYGPLFQKKEMNVNMLGASLGLQQMGTVPAQYLTQGAVPIQLLGNQLVAGSLLADSHTVKLNNQNRMSTASSQPVMTSSIMAAGLLHSSIPGGPCRS